MDFSLEGILVRFPKPFFRSSRNAWFIQIGKRQFALGPEKAEADRVARRLLVQELGKPADGLAGDLKAIEVCDLFVGHLVNEGWRSKDWYQYFLQKFSDQVGHVNVRDLKPFHLTRWSQKKSWGSTTRNRVIGIVKQAFAWAFRQGLIAVDPFVHVDRPTMARRTRVLTTDERSQIIAAIPDEAFRNFLFAIQETGARPGEVRGITAENYNRDIGAWVLREHKTDDKTSIPRVIYLTPSMKALTEVLAAKRMNGPLFVNKYGRPWTSNAIRCRFRAIRQRFPELTGVVAYTYRHTFTTDALLRQVPIATVSELLGHASTRMVEEVYGHLDQHKGYLAKELLKARGQ